MGSPNQNSKTILNSIHKSYTTKILFLCHGLPGKSGLKLNELIFKPYNAIDLQHILRIRVKKALHAKAVKPGVIEKIAAMASCDHGDARKAVALLAKSAYLAEKAGTKLTLDLVDKAATQLDQDRYLTLLRSAPAQLQAAMAAVVDATRQNQNGSVSTGETYDAYKTFCDKAKLRPLTGRAFGDLISELDIYSLLRSRVLSRGRYGRSREIILDLPQELTEKVYSEILSNFDMQN